MADLQAIHPSLPCPEQTLLINFSTLTRPEFGSIILFNTVLLGSLQFNWHMS